MQTEQINGLTILSEEEAMQTNGGISTTGSILRFFSGGLFGMCYWVGYGVTEATK